MGVFSKLQRVLGLVEGNEERVAKEIGERTKASEEQVKAGLEQATDALSDSNSS